MAPCVRRDRGRGRKRPAKSVRVDLTARLVSMTGEEAPDAPHEVQQDRGGNFRGSREARAGGRGQGDGESGGEQEGGGFLAQRGAGHGGSWEGAPGAVPIDRAGASPGKSGLRNHNVCEKHEGGRSMVRRGDPEVLRQVVLFLRSHAGLTQADFGRASRVPQAEVSRFESGKQAPSEEVLSRMAEAAGVPWEYVNHLRRFYASALAAIDRRTAALPDTVEPSLRQSILDTALLTISSYLLELETREEPAPPPDEARCEAAETWEALERFSLQERREMIEPSLHASRSWALAERICEASAEAAKHRTDEALELADLALWIAGRVEGEDGWRSQVQGYAWAFVANARRAANDPEGAGEAFSTARELWRAGGGAAPGALSEERMLEVEGVLL